MLIAHVRPLVVEIINADDPDTLSVIDAIELPEGNRFRCTDLDTLLADAGYVQRDGWTIQFDRNDEPHIMAEVFRWPRQSG